MGLLRYGLWKPAQVGRGVYVAAIGGFCAGTVLVDVNGGGSRRDCRPAPHVERDGSEQNLSACLDQTNVADTG